MAWQLVIQLAAVEYLALPDTRTPQSSCCAQAGLHAGSLMPHIVHLTAAGEVNTNRVGEAGQAAAVQMVRRCCSRHTVLAELLLMRVSLGETSAPGKTAAGRCTAAGDCVVVPHAVQRM